ncbi:MAG: hypothetical protein AAF415_07780 [Pseudomonadota bacterium]
MNYDRGDWHIDSLEDGAPEHYAWVHIGLFLRWAVVRGLEFGRFQAVDENGRDVTEQAHAATLEAAEQVRTGSMTGSVFLEEHFDTKFFSGVLVGSADDFARVYYLQTGKYLEDYSTAVPEDQTYKVDETDEIFTALKPIIDHRYEAFEAAGGKAPGGFMEKLRLAFGGSPRWTFG